MKVPAVLKIAIVLWVTTLCQPIAAQEKAVLALDNYFSALVRNGQFNGNVLVAENGRIIYEKSFGYADFSAKKLNEKNTSFPIASITKTFTSTPEIMLNFKC